MKTIHQPFQSQTHFFTKKVTHTGKLKKNKISNNSAMCFEALIENNRTHPHLNIKTKFTPLHVHAHNFAHTHAYSHME